jgi:hypothetical protein
MLFQGKLLYVVATLSAVWFWGAQSSQSTQVPAHVDVLSSGSDAGGMRAWRIEPVADARHINEPDTVSAVPAGNEARLDMAAADTVNAALRLAVPPLSPDAVAVHDRWPALLV